MLAGITKIGWRICIHIDALESLYSKLQGLPKKEKTFFYLSEAVAFLYPAISDALEKNYTKEDIFTVLGDSGWEIESGTWEYVWGMVRARKNLPNRKKSSAKNAHKKREKSSSEVQKKPVEEKSRVENQAPSDSKESQIQANKAVEKENFQSQSSAYFDMPPDTEDL